MSKIQILFVEYTGDAPEAVLDQCLRMFHQRNDASVAVALPRTASLSGPIGSIKELSAPARIETLAPRRAKPARAARKPGRKKNVDEDTRTRTCANCQYTRTGKRFKKICPGCGSAWAEPTAEKGASRDSETSFPATASA